jgi:hypothetical protein
MSMPKVRAGKEEAEWHCERATRPKKPEEVGYSGSKQPNENWRWGLVDRSDDAYANAYMIEDNGEDGNAEAWPWPS